MGETLFISDLHLDKERPQFIALCKRFLSQDAPRADALYILGDLFEYWLGDDDPATEMESVISALRRLSDLGVPVYFVHGNRDFLIGTGFSQRSGCQLLADTHVIDLYKIPTLIMHGDTLCTDDIAYQRFRKLIRSRLIRKILLSLSLKRRYSIATILRNKSRMETHRKSAGIMDVNQSAVRQIMDRKNVAQLIHGHTHRPTIHNFKLNGKSVRRIVLGDWYKQGSVLRCTPAGCKLETLSLTT
jgi:UDP-2,3-diacylglucosamine hydrolase